MVASSTSVIPQSSHNPYFNRWFSAIKTLADKWQVDTCHNPYFNRWFSAINTIFATFDLTKTVTILILIDGFLQYDIEAFNGIFHAVTILILIDGFLQ